MAIELKQNLRQTQNLLLSPQIQQAIKILTLGRLELQEYVAEEMLENPCLEESEGTRLDTQTHGEGDSPLSTREMEFLGRSETSAAPEAEKDPNLADLGEALISATADQGQSAPQSLFEIAESDVPLYDKLNSKASTLHEDIEKQVRMMHLTDHELDCAYIILQYINDDGYLSCSLQELAAEYNLELEDLEYALSAVQKCEPTGIGARDTQECLLLQVRARAETPRLVERMLKDFWPELQKVDLKRIARLARVELEDVRQAILFIRSELDPRPARQYGDGGNLIVEPDVYIFQREGTWTVSLNEDGLPRLKVSKQYEQLLEQISSGERGRGDAELKNFVNTRMKSAKWLVRALLERNKTILRVAEVIAEKQAAFLEHGVEHLKPMTLKTIAEELNLHESTISRTTTNKYVQTPRGLFELKYFFNSAMAADNGQQLANETIKVWVGEYIKAEEATNPLSDQEISDIIAKEKNLKVARRTVAKYRESLGIPSSSKRMQRF
jgi:RNA polymerase sigma-54 factor